MAITGEMDLGIGDIAPNAYVRIKNVIYSARIPEWEIEIQCYFSKESRKLEILRTFVGKHFYDEGHIDFLSEENRQWLIENITSKAVRPLTEMKFATKNIDGFPKTTDPKQVLSFFYNFIKQYHIMGIINNPIDDNMNEENIINNFKLEHPELFVG